MTDASQLQDLRSERALVGVRRENMGSMDCPVLGDAVLTGKIGEGAASGVYFARLPESDQTFAVRVMRCLQEQKERYSHFLAHARAAQNVKSHHLVDIKETGAEPNIFYQLMEYVPSVSALAHLSALRDKLKPGLSEAEALEMATAASTGLAALHAANVPHLNLSPSSILIPKDANGTLDFARCKLADQGLAYHEYFAKVLDGTSAETGTPGFLSPEQAQGSKNPGKSSDVFALGATLYAMLAGHAPFDGPSVPVILSVTCMQEVSDLRTWRPDVSRATSRVVDLCLRKGPSMRFPDAGAVLKAVRICRESLGAPANVQDAAIEEIQALIRQDEVKEQLLSRFFPPPPPDMHAAVAAEPIAVPAEVEEEVLPPATPETAVAAAQDLPPATPEHAPHNEALLDVPPPPGFGEVNPAGSGSNLRMPSEPRRPETKLFDDLLKPKVAEASALPVTDSLPVEVEVPAQEPAPMPVPEKTPGTTGMTDPLANEFPRESYNELPPPAADVPQHKVPVAKPDVSDEEPATVVVAPPVSAAPKPNALDSDPAMEATMIGAAMKIDPAAASSAAQLKTEEPSAVDQIPDAASPEQPAPIPPAPPTGYANQQPEWMDPVKVQAAMDDGEEPPAKNSSWVPLIAALLMFGALTGVLWDKGYLEKWGLIKGVPPAVAKSGTNLDPIETGTPPPPPSTSLPTDPIPGEKPPESGKADPEVAGSGKNPSDTTKHSATKQTDDELRKLAEMRVKAEEEARKLAIELQKKADEEAKRLEDERKQKLAAEELRLLKEKEELQKKMAEKTAREEAAKREAAERPKEVILDLGENVALALVLVPGGTFKMGTPPETAMELARAAGLDAKEYLSESPQRTVRMPPFYIGKTPVTVGQFKRFADATGYKTAAERVGEAYVLKNRQWARVKGASWRNPGFAQTESHPVVLVSHRDCEAFIAWASRLAAQPMRLPTEAEWEYAARGPENRLYPWGNAWDGKKANHADKGLAGNGPDGQPISADVDGQPFTSPVGSYDNASWCGALDMAGNVLQWCADAFEPYPQPGAPMLESDEVPPDAKRVQRGGSFLLSPGDLRGATRRASKPGAASLEFGMRLAFTPRL